MKRIRIEVPATSANLGPGFDSLGMALNVVDTIEVELDPDQAEIGLGEVQGASEALHETDNLLCHAYKTWMEDTGEHLPGARFHVRSEIPMGRGMGSSAAALVAGLAAAAFAAGDKEPYNRILRLATRMEGHPDNVAPALLGGVTVAFCDGEQVHALNVANHLALGVALFVPDQRLSTASTRAALPDSVPLADAVFNVGRAAYLVTALQWGRWPDIGPAMSDRLHQPYRTRVIPALDPVIAAAREAGAYGAALSGAGPSVLAVGPADLAPVFGAAMERKAQSREWPGRALVTSVRRWGVSVKEVEPGK